MRTIGWFCGVIFLFFLAPLYAQEPVGQVSMLTGRADVLRGDIVEPLAQGDPVYREDVVRTKLESILTIVLNDGSALSLDENSRLELSNYATDGAEPSGVFSLLRGRVRSVVTDTFSQRRNAFKMRTSTALIGVQGTDFMTQALALATRVSVYTGTVEIRNIDPRIPDIRILNANEVGVIRAGAPPELPSALLRGDETVGAMMGSGSQISIQSDGMQASDPAQAAPSVPPVIAVPPEPTIPGRPNL